MFYAERECNVLNTNNGLDLRKERLLADGHRTVSSAAIEYGRCDLQVFLNSTALK